MARLPCAFSFPLAFPSPLSLQLSSHASEVWSGDTFAFVFWHCAGAPYAWARCLQAPEGKGIGWEAIVESCLPVQALIGIAGASVQHLAPAEHASFAPSGICIVRRALPCGIVRACESFSRSNIEDARQQAVPLNEAWVVLSCSWHCLAIRPTDRSPLVFQLTGSLPEAKLSTKLVKAGVWAKKKSFIAPYCSLNS